MQLLQRTESAQAEASQHKRTRVQQPIIGLRPEYVNLEGMCTRYGFESKKCARTFVKVHLAKQDYVKIGKTLHVSDVAICAKLRDLAAVNCDPTTAPEVEAVTVDTILAKHGYRRTA